MVEGLCKRNLRGLFNRVQNGVNLFSWNLEMVESLLTVGVVSVIPIIINWLNPSDTRYGRT
jgi:hypothetical protein